jgi:hypothetical protein
MAVKPRLATNLDSDDPLDEGRALERECPFEVYAEPAWNSATHLRPARCVALDQDSVPQTVHHLRRLPHILQMGFASVLM